MSVSNLLVSDTAVCLACEFKVKHHLQFLHQEHFNRSDGHKRSRRKEEKRVLEYAMVKSVECEELATAIFQ